jgi:hypothetical protein
MVAEPRPERNAPAAALLDPDRLQPRAVVSAIGELCAHMTAAARRECKPCRAPSLPVEHAPARADERELEIAGRLVGRLDHERIAAALDPAERHAGRAVEVAAGERVAERRWIADGSRCTAIRG